MTTQHFPNDWATAELLKQYLKNYRQYTVRKGWMAKWKDHIALSSTAGSSSPPCAPAFCNIDDDDKDNEWIIELDLQTYHVYFIL